MHAILDRNLFLVKEHTGVFKAANSYDIFDPHTGEKILECREDELGVATRILRFTDYKRFTPFDIRVRTPGPQGTPGAPVVRITRGVSFFRSRVRVHDETDRVVGGFQQKLLSIGGAFDVLDAADGPLCTLHGKWTGWNFRFLRGEQQLAHVTKKWAGAGREFFTSADNYILEISDAVPQSDPVRELMLAAVLCIDMVLKE